MCPQKPNQAETRVAGGASPGLFCFCFCFCCSRAQAAPARAPPLALGSRIPAGAASNLLARQPERGAERAAGDPASPLGGKSVSACELVSHCHYIGVRALRHHKKKLPLEYLELICWYVVVCSVCPWSGCFGLHLQQVAQRVEQLVNCGGGARVIEGSRSTASNPKC